MNTLQDVTPQAGISLSERLKKAYERVSPNLRPEASRSFADFHRITVDTFRKKRCGDAVVTELECEWMESYRPF